MGSTLPCPLPAALGPNCPAQQPVTVWGLGQRPGHGACGPVGCAAELLCGYFSQSLLYTLCTRHPSQRRELAGVDAPWGLPGHTGLDLPWVDVTGDGADPEEARGSPSGSALCVPGLPGHFVQRAQLLVPGFLAGSAQPGVPRDILNTAVVRVGRARCRPVCSVRYWSCDAAPAVLGEGGD